MAAVAGAVAEEVLAAMADAAQRSIAPMSTTAATSRCISRRGESYTIGMVDGPDRLALDARARSRGGGLASRGVATSGWHGRSFSLGIADAVTVLARTAAASRRRRHRHRQRRRSSRPSRHHADPGPRNCSQTATSAIVPVTRDVGALSPSGNFSGAARRRSSSAEQLRARGLIARRRPASARRDRAISRLAALVGPPLSTLSTAEVSPMERQNA